MIISEHHLQADTKLMKIIDALNSLGSSFGLRNCHKQKRRQNPDDGDDGQHFRQRKRGIFIQVAAGHVQAILDFAFSFNGQWLVSPHDTLVEGD